MKKAVLFILLLVVPLVNCASVLAASPMPGVEDSVFADALDADKLRLEPCAVSVTIDSQSLYDEIIRLNTALEAYGLETYNLPSDPVEGEIVITGADFYDFFSAYSLFPGGGKMLLVEGGNLALIYDGESGQTRAIVPAEGLDPAYCQLLYTLLCKPEPAGVAWSPDGRYIALSFMRNTMLMARFDCNLLLIDTQEGTARPLLDLPYPANIVAGDFAGVPFRAVFDPDKPVLYYDMYRVPSILGNYNELRAYDMDTGETRVVSLSDFTATTSDPALLVTPLGIAHTYDNIRVSKEYGIAFRRERGAGTYVHGDPQSPLAAHVRNGRLLGVSDAYGLLLTGFSGTSEAGVGPTIHLFPLDGVSAALYDTVLSLEPDRAPGERLTEVNLADLPNESAVESAMRPRLHNAVFSPDGEYILLAVRIQVGEYALYIHDIARGLTGKVDISAFENSLGYVGAYGALFTNSDTGMHWLPDGRIVLATGDGMRVFELSIAK